MLIGLTGGIATGKSTVSRMLQARGARIVDADLIARQVVEPGTLALKQIAETFGDEVLLPNGELNRAELGKRVFANEELRQQLMKITHPVIRAEIRRQVAEAKKKGEPLIVIDAPLLIESNLQKEVELVVVVYTDDATQLKRLMQRDKLSEEEARRRIASQMPIEEKRKYADILIDNRGTIEDLERQVEHVYRKLMGEL